MSMKTTFNEIMYDIKTVNPRSRVLKQIDYLTREPTQQEQRQVILACCWESCWIWPYAST